MITSKGSVIFSNKKPLKLQPKSELKGLSYLLVKIIFLTDLLMACTSNNLATSLVAGFLVKLKFKSA